MLADRFVLTLVNTGAVKPGDFEIRENGGVLLSDSGRKKVLTAWQKKKSDQILHPFLQEKISWGLVPYVQALLLARSLRGDLDDYPPFMWKQKVRSCVWRYAMIRGDTLLEVKNHDGCGCVRCEYGNP